MSATQKFAPPISYVEPEELQELRWEARRLHDAAQEAAKRYRTAAKAFLAAPRNNLGVDK